MWNTGCTSKYRMRLLQTLLVAATLAAPLGFGVATAQQAEPMRLAGFYVSAFSGGAAHSDLQRTSARAEWPVGTGLERRDFSRRLAPATAPAVAAAMGYWWTPRWGTRLQASLIPSHFEVSVSQREQAGLPPDSLLMGDDRFSDLRIWSADLQLMFRAPFTPRGRVAPYAFLGGGVVRYEPVGNEPLPPEAVETFRGRKPMELSAVLGGGAIVPLHRRGLALNFELSDRLVRTPVRHSAASATDASGIRLTTDGPGQRAGDERV